MRTNPYVRLYILFFALTATYLASWGVAHAAMAQLGGSLW